MCILKLLEEHHKRLGNILKGILSRLAKEEDEITPIAAKISVSVQEFSLPSKAEMTAKSKSRRPSLPPTARATAQYLSNSIASNLATATGIPNPQKGLTPASPLVLNEDADGRFIQDNKSGGNLRDVTHRQLLLKTPLFVYRGHLHTDVGAATPGKQKVRAAVEAASTDAPSPTLCTPYNFSRS
jgi:hypothetical protein